MAKEFTVGEVATRSGVAVSALHFYETKGLIESHRTAGNQRRYRHDVLRRVAIIKVAQELGISLAEVGEALSALPEDHVPNRADWSEISGRWADELDERIARLKKLRNGLNHCIGCGCLSLDRCQLFNRHDRLAVEGPGPRRLLAKKRLSD
jgi:MerR family redox-sensitive transcriptional activator SoxR